ncbi:GGDEF domain-containing protein [Ruminococcaceae bacterium OttesenSCG-928-L11]|nr:GGDEF domain-containing protein [Ruminococcaceae bacterium OttesenSCG-928-L11]
MPTINKSKMADVFRSTVPEAKRHAFFCDLYQTTYRTIVLIGTLVVLFECIMMTMVFMKAGPMSVSRTRTVYFFMYAFLFFVTLACVIYVLGNKALFEKKPRIFQLICNVYGMVVCLWGSMMSAFSHQFSPDISVFLYVSLCVAFFIPMSLWQAVLVFGVNQICFLIGAIYFSPAGQSMMATAINSLFTTCLAAAMASMLYRNRVNAFMSRSIIVEQNQQIRSINEQLQQQVVTDELTRIHNRRYLEREIPAAILEARDNNRPIAVMMLDIDNFKQYNDIYGHRSGDLCLQQIASLIKQATPEGENHIARYGGEEFVVLLIGIEQQEVEATAHAIRETVEQADIPHTGCPRGHVTVSIGVCFSGGEGHSTFEQMLRYADDALYYAKAYGRNRVELYGGVLQ